MSMVEIPAPPSGPYDRMYGLYLNDLAQDAVARGEDPAPYHRAYADYMVKFQPTDIPPPPIGGYDTDYTTLLTELASKAVREGRDPGPYYEANSKYRDRFQAFEEGLSE